MSDGATSAAVPHAFSALATAAYCPRQCYYARRSGDIEDVPEPVSEVRSLAFRYDELLDADDAALRAAPIDVSPLQFRRNLGCARARLDRFEEVVDPDVREVYLQGTDAHGVAHKLLEGADGEPPVPSLVSAGSPPEQGVYEPQSVRAVAAAKALAHERQRPVERALYEFPAHGVVRAVGLTTRRKAAYRRTVRTLDAMDGPPARVDDEAKCDACQYRAECGVKTRSLRSLLGR
jgi:CRISPR-associated exonuclease Cas4